MNQLKLTLMSMGIKRIIQAILVFAYIAGASFYWGANTSTKLVPVFAVFINYIFGTRFIMSYIYDNEFEHRISHAFRRDLLDVVVNFIVITALLMYNQLLIQTGGFVLNPIVFGLIYGIVFAIYFISTLRLQIEYSGSAETMAQNSIVRFSYGYTIKKKHSTKEKKCCIRE